MAGWGWVRRNAGLITDGAHPLEKSAPGFTDTSIHRLGSSKVWVLWWESGTAVGFSRGDVFLLDRVRFGYGYRKERTLGSIDHRVREGLPCLRELSGPPQRREDAARSLQATRR